MASTYLLQPLEKALNRYLALDPEAPKRLLPLDGKIVTVALTTPKLYCQLRIHQQKIVLSLEECYPADLTIKGTPFSLLSLALSPAKKERFFATDLSIEGDAELGQQVLDLFAQLDIDWEEYLSQWIGDFPAHQLGRFTKGLLSWGKEAKDRLFENTAEYLHEERNWFPPKPLLQDFLHEVDELRMAVDRLEARVKNVSN
jgi:ubiquinone biosynthesis protein UbiJ